MLGKAEGMTPLTRFVLHKWSQPRHRQSTLARSLRNVGLATWFGGTLMGVVALNRQAREITDPVQRARFLEGAWSRWRVPAALGVGMHLAGSTSLGWSGRHRAPLQKGMPRAMTADTAATAAALAAAAAASRMRRRTVRAAAQDPGRVERLERRWQRTEALVPLFAAGSLVAQAKLAEQQRPIQTARGALARLTPGR